MNLSFALGEDVDLRRRLMIKIGTPLTAAGNHTSETASPEAIDRITLEVYRAAQGSKAASVSRATGDAGAL